MMESAPPEARKGCVGWIAMPCTPSSYFFWCTFSSEISGSVVLAAASGEEVASLWLASRARKSHTLMQLSWPAVTSFSPLEVIETQLSASECASAIFLISYIAEKS